MQIFELWEAPAAEGHKPRHYVKCIYNHDELSLAHHPNGGLLSSTICTDGTEIAIIVALWLPLPRSMAGAHSTAAEQVPALLGVALRLTAPCDSHFGVFYHCMRHGAKKY